MPLKKQKKHNIHTAPTDLPQFCDFGCSFAEFGDPETIGACRKEVTIWCKKYKKYNNKHNMCLRERR